jgi:hypothetical protein
MYRLTCDICGVEIEGEYITLERESVTGFIIDYPDMQWDVPKHVHWDGLCLGQVARLMERRPPARLTDDEVAEAESFNKRRRKGGLCG